MDSGAYTTRDIGVKWRAEMLEKLNRKSCSITELIRGRFVRSFGYRIINRWEEAGIVKTYRDGQVRMVELTPIGKSLVEPMWKISSFASSLF